MSFCNLLRTIKHVDCNWIFTTVDDQYSVTQCDTCHKYQRNVLNSALLTVSKADWIGPGCSSGQSHTNYKYCDTPEKAAVCHQLPPYSM